MTIINPNSIAGITSVTAQADIINFYKSDGNQAGLGLNGVNFNTTAGISTFNNLVVGGTLTYEDVKNVDAIGIVTAREGIFLPDNKKVQLGNVAGTADLEIFHNSSNSWNYIRGVANNLAIQAKSGENSITCYSDDRVELYFNHSIKVSTTASGARVHDQLQVDGTVFAAVGLKVNADNQKIRLGASDDLEIYHDSSHSILKNSTGYLRLMAGGSGVTISNADNSETMAAFIKDGAVDLYHNNSKKFETTSSGALVTGTLSSSSHIYCGNQTDGPILYFGVGNDLGLWHDGTFSHIKNNTNQLRIRSDDLRLMDEAAGETYLTGIKDGAVDLYHNNSKKFETTSSGASISGLLAVSGSTSQTSTFTGNGVTIAHASGSNIFIGTQSGTDGKIQVTNNADLHFRTNNTERLRITSSGQIKKAQGANVTSLKTYNSNADAFWLDHYQYQVSSTYQRYTDIVSIGDGTWGSNIRFFTNANGSQNGIERLRITSAGKFGFGTTSPYLNKVTIKSDVSAGTHNWALHLLNGTHAADSRVGLAFQANNNDASNTWDGAGIYAANDGSTGACHTMFGTVIDGSFTERLRIRADGQLVQHTTHTSGNSAHQNTSWYGDDANHYNIEVRDFNEMYALKTNNANNYSSIVYKREKMTNYCDIEFTMSGQSDVSGSGYYHFGLTINSDGSDTFSNFDLLVLRSNGGNTSLNQIRLDKGGGGQGFDYTSNNLVTFFDGNERHYQIKIRGRRFSIYIDGSHVLTRYTNANLVRTHGYPGFSIYEASTVNPWMKVRDFKVTNHTPNTGVPGWEVVFDTPSSSNASSSFLIDNMDNPQTVEMRYWRLRHSGGDTNTYMRLGWQGSFKSSGYYDIGQYHNQSGNWNASRGHNQAQACPFHYDFTGSTNYYSGCITIRRVTSGGHNTGFIYKCEHVVDYDSGSTQYHVLVNGQVNFGNTNPWTKIQLYTATGTNFNYGSMQVLAQY